MRMAADAPARASAPLQNGSRGSYPSVADHSHVPAARLRGLLAACESLSPAAAAPAEAQPANEPSEPLAALLACECCRRAGRHEQLLALLEADLLRELAGAGPNPKPCPHTYSSKVTAGHGSACLAPSYREALELDAGLPIPVRARIAALNALRGVLLAGRPRTALVLGLGLGPGAAPLLHAAGQRAEAARSNNKCTGTVEYMLGVLGRLSQAKVAKPAPLGHAQQASDLAAWLESAACQTLSYPTLAAAPPAPVREGGRAGRRGAHDPSLDLRAAPATRLGAFLAQLRAADALFPDPGPSLQPSTAPHADVAAAGVANVDAGTGGGGGQGGGRFARPPAPFMGAWRLADQEGRSADAAAGWSAWAAAALRARAVQLACRAKGKNPDPEPDMGPHRAAGLFEYAEIAPSSASRDASPSDMAFARWLCCGNGFGAEPVGATDGVGGAVAPDAYTADRKRKRLAVSTEALTTSRPASVPGADAAAGVSGGALLPATASASSSGRAPWSPESRLAPAAVAPASSGAATAGSDGGGTTGQAAPEVLQSMEQAAPEPGAQHGPEPVRCELAMAVAAHGPPTPALLAPALARLLDARAWARIAALGRAAAARPTNVNPVLIPNMQSDLAEGPASGRAEGVRVAAQYGGMAEEANAESGAPAAGERVSAVEGGPVTGGGVADAECAAARQLLRVAAALSAFLRGLLEPRADVSQASFPDARSNLPDYRSECSHQVA